MEFLPDNLKKLVEPSDFESAPSRLTNEDFKKIIPKLCLADIFLTNIVRQPQKSFKLIIYLRNENKLKCNKCNIDNLDYLQLYTHLNSEDHKSLIQEPNSVYDHPVFTTSHQKSDKLNVKRYEFLYAYVRAKKIEECVTSEGLSLMKSEHEFSGKAIVERSTAEELDVVWEALTKFTRQEIRNKMPRDNYSKMLQEETERGNPTNIKRIPSDKIRTLQSIFRNYNQRLAERQNNPKSLLESNFPQGKKLKDIIVNGKILDLEGLSNKARRQLKKNLLNNDDLFFISSLIGPIKEKTPDTEKIKENPNAMRVLRLLAALEDELGSLGTKIMNLLMQAIKKSKTSNIEQIHSEILTFENNILMETAVEKLKGSIEADLLPKRKLKSVLYVIEKTEDLLTLAYGDTLLSPKK